jgi:alkylation response protein AidB-like acyl-CoA dehydrogenase
MPVPRADPACTGALDHGQQAADHLSARTVLDLFAWRVALDVPDRQIGMNGSLAWAFYQMAKCLERQLGEPYVFGAKQLQDVFRVYGKPRQVIPDAGRYGRSATIACWIRADSRSYPRDLPAETARWSTITQIYEGTNQIQRMVMARQLLK